MNQQRQPRACTSCSVLCRRCELRASASSCAFASASAPAPPAPLPLPASSSHGSSSSFSAGTSSAHWQPPCRMLVAQRQTAAWPFILRARSSLHSFSSSSASRGGMARALAAARGARRKRRGRAQSASLVGRARTVSIIPVVRANSSVGRHKRCQSCRRLPASALAAAAAEMQRSLCKTHTAPLSPQAHRAAITNSKPSGPPCARTRTWRRKRCSPRCNPG